MNTPIPLRPSIPASGRAVGALLLHAFIIWAGCATTIAIGRAVTSMETTLVIHAVAAPAFAVAASAHYFQRRDHAPPLVTASVVLAFVASVDFFVVALVIERSLEMFRSALGTWLPLLLIFAATAGTGWTIGLGARRGRPREDHGTPGG